MTSIPRSILKNVNVINIILLLGIILFLFMAVLPSYRTVITPPPPVTGKSAPQDIKTKEPIRGESPPDSDYSLIAENNLFHPDRKPVTSKGRKEKPVQKPEFVLYGTLIADDLKIAYMEDAKSPYSTRGRGRRQRALHIGEELSGYTLSEVYHNRVVIIRDEERIELWVSDPSKQKRQKAEATSKTKKPEKPARKKASNPDILPYRGGLNKHR